MRTKCPLLFVLLTAVPAQCSAGDDIVIDQKQAAKEVLPDIIQELQQTNPNDQLTLGVFPITDNSGTVSAGWINFCNPIHAYLTEFLRQATATQCPRVSVLSQAEMRGVTKLCPGAKHPFNYADIESLRRLTNEAQLDIGVFGQVTAEASQNCILLKIWVLMAQSHYTVDIRIAGSSGSKPPVGPGDGHQVVGNKFSKVESNDSFGTNHQDGNHDDGRFRRPEQRMCEVIIEARNKRTNQWTVLPLEQASSSESIYSRALLLRLNRAEYQGQPYRIIVRHLGRPLDYQGVDPSAADNSDRVYAAAVFVDGVSTFMRNFGSDEVPAWERDTRLPIDVPKNLLTGHGRRFAPGNPTNTREGLGRFKKGHLVDAPGIGGAEWTIRGFQIGADSARQFRFGQAEDSVGVGVSKHGEIGVISAYFYAQEMPGDRAAGVLGGTEAGPEVSSPVFEVQIQNWYPTPVDVWHIRYRYDGDAPPESNCQPYMVNAK